MKDLNLIELTNLEKRYGKKEALNGVNLTIGRGKIIGLLGPNGSGKTTLIKLLNGLLQPTSGEIKVNGKAPGVDSKKIISFSLVGVQSDGKEEKYRFRCLVVQICFHPLYHNT